MLAGENDDAPVRDLDWIAGLQANELMDGCCTRNTNDLCKSLGVLASKIVTDTGSDGGSGHRP